MEILPSKIGENFGYQMGLRLEAQNMRKRKFQCKNSGGGGYRDTANNFSIKYPVSLFPSVFLSQKVKKWPGTSTELQPPR